MKKVFTSILALVLALSLGVTALATNGSSGSSVDTFNPALEITTSADGKTITVVMQELPDGLSAELVIPCDGWSGAVVKDSTGETIRSTFGKVDIDPAPEEKDENGVVVAKNEMLVNAVTFDALGGEYTITKATSSGGTSSGSTYYSDLNEFWRDVEEDIENAGKGETVEVELGKTDKLAWFIIDALRSNPDVGLKITKNGKVVVEIPAGKAIANEAGRVYYSIDDLAELYSKYPEGNIPAEELPEPIPAPSEEPEAPVEDPVEDPAEEPEEEPAVEPEQPAVSEPEEAEATRGNISGVVIGLGAVALIAIIAILVIVLRKKEVQ